MQHYVLMSLAQALALPHCSKVSQGSASGERGSLCFGLCSFLFVGECCELHSFLRRLRLQASKVVCQASVSREQVCLKRLVVLPEHTRTSSALDICCMCVSTSSCSQQSLRALRSSISRALLLRRSHSSPALKTGSLVQRALKQRPSCWKHTDASSEARLPRSRRRFRLTCFHLQTATQLSNTRLVCAVEFACCRDASLAFERQSRTEENN